MEMAAKPPETKNRIRNTVEPPGSATEDLLCAIHLRHDQLSCRLLLGMEHHLMGIADLDYPSPLHDGDSVRYLEGDHEVMGYIDHGESLGVLQTFQQP